MAAAYPANAPSATRCNPFDRTHRTGPNRPLTDAYCPIKCRFYTFFAFSAPIRRMIYTTNAIEALNSKLRRAVRTRGHFPGDEAAMKLLYLVLNHAAEQWKRPPREWTEAKTQFAIIFGDRFIL